ncbi:MAG: hypothetical protein LBS77_02640 [Desulfovibrio sp.]|jgi:hypothetical protein|nr:hypothetical protein [Desulfovibrio sp.]
MDTPMGNWKKVVVRLIATALANLTVVGFGPAIFGGWIATLVIILYAILSKIREFHLRDILLGNYLYLLI